MDVMFVQSFVSALKLKALLSVNGQVSFKKKVLKNSLFRVCFPSSC